MYDKNQWKHDDERFSHTMVLAACGSVEPGSTAGYRGARFPTGDLLPTALVDENRFLIFYPLHYNTYSIGYLAMDGISQASKLNLHESIFTFLEIAIENVRKKGLLRQLNVELDNLYVHDALTGLYNRFGFERYAGNAFAGFLSKGGVQVMFVDMDDMKGINDCHGHEAGDIAIRAAARILKSVCDPGDFLMRFGGDEFLVIAPCQEECLADQIVEAAERGSYGEALPCRLGLSIGLARADDRDPKSLDQCIQEADTDMYLRKKRKKSGKAQ